MVAFALACAVVHAEPVADSGYARDARSVIAKSGYGLCWRTGSWTPATTETECDPDMAKAKPAPVAEMPEKPLKLATVLVMPAAQPVCEFAYTLGNDETFAFDGATLTPAAKSAIDREIARLHVCDERAPVRVTGHADILGTPQYNLKLSARRADAVANYLTASGIAVARIEQKAAGESVPVKACDRNLKRKSLIACLAPNRRTVIGVGRSAK